MQMATTPFSFRRKLYRDCNRSESKLHELYAFSAPITVNSGATSMQNFCMGTSNLQANGFTIDDTNSGGNGNNVVNRNECINANLGVKNNGCVSETGISATLTTPTAGVTITREMPLIRTWSLTPAVLTPCRSFKISNSFVCGTNVVLNLNLTYAGGSKTIVYSVPTCTGGPNQTIPASSIATTDSSQPDRLGRIPVMEAPAAERLVGGRSIAPAPETTRSLPLLTPVVRLLVSLSTPTLPAAPAELPAISSAQHI